MFIVIGLAVAALVEIRFRLLDDKILVQLPQLDLQIFERLPMGLVIWIALQIPTPPVSVLYDNVFCRVHLESIAGHFRCASEGGK